jgi:hypothetical protein
MNTLEEYALVRVKKLKHPPEKYDGWRVNKRSPRVGDIGTILDILHAPNLPDDYVVESSEPDGIPIWLGDFDADELEPF